MTVPVKKRRLHPLLGGVLVAGLLAAIAFSGWQIAAELRAQGHWRDALAALEADDFPRARRGLTECVKAWPENAEAHFVSARAARRNGDIPDALRLLDRAEKLDWVSEAIELERMLCRVAVGELAEFARPLSSFVDRDHPDKALIAEVIAPAYLRNYQLREARRYAEVWVECRPNSAAAHSCLATTARRQRDYQTMRDSYRRAVELAPDSYRDRLELVRGLLDAFESTEALPHIEYLRQRHPDDLIVLRELANCLCLRGESAEARPLLDRVLEGRKDDVEALAARGRLEFRENNTAEAERWLRMAAEKAGHDRTVVLPFIRALKVNGKEEEARRWEAKLERARIDNQRLEKVAQEAAANPTDPGPRCEAGEIFLRNGQEEEGLRWLSSALRHDPNHPATHLALAKYYDAKGQPDLAARHRVQGESKQGPR